MPNARTLAGVLHEMATASPEQTCIHYHSSAISYRELDDESRRVARGLLALGFRRGDRISALLGNQPEWLIACFATSYIGATFVPLNTWFKHRELEWTMRHAGVSALITVSAFLNQDYGAMLRQIKSRLPDLRLVAFVGQAPPGELTWRELGELGRSVPELQLTIAGATASSDDLAFVLYTSGSTAEPKGVVLRHGSVIENSYQIGARRKLTAEDRVWLGSPLFYALGATNALPAALTHGASLVLHDYFEAGRAIDAISSSGATVWYGTGNMARAILDHPRYTRRKLATLLKGNAGTVAAYKRLTLVELGISEATPAYGLTESYGQCTGGMPDDPLEVKLHTNGTLLPGFEMSIVDPSTLKPVGRETTGLILLRGHTTDGYLNNPAETSKAIMPDGSLCTGDLGHLDHMGRLIFHSRMKEVIKTGGINVSPVEVEQLLLEHRDITDAHVVSVPDPVRGELIVAFVVSRGSLSDVQVRDFVRDRAALFKVPHHILFRREDQLPRLASGKVAKYVLKRAAIAELSGTRGTGDS